MSERLCNVVDLNEAHNPAKLPGFCVEKRKKELIINKFKTFYLIGHILRNSTEKQRRNN